MSESEGTVTLRERTLARPDRAPGYITARAVILPWTLALLVACGEGDVSSITRPITDGTEDRDHGTVGYLAAGGGVGCTGTVVGRRTVLTAAHCISGGTQTFVLGGFSYVSSSSATHPQYNPVSHDNDIGLLLLERGVHLVPSALDPKSRPVGAAVTLVGFGATTEGGSDSGTRRVATNTISSLHTTSFNMAGTGGGKGNVCHHDSGAPVFVGGASGEAQLGVVIGGAPPCGNIGIAMRVDIYLPWLRTTALGDVAVKGEVGAKFGLPCATGQECASGLCQEDQASGDRYCTAACDGASATCPEGGECVAPAGGGQARCQLPLPPAVEESGCVMGRGRPQTGSSTRLTPWGLALLLILIRRRDRRCWLDPAATFGS